MTTTMLPQLQMSMQPQPLTQPQPDSPAPPTAALNGHAVIGTGEPLQAKVGVNEDTAQRSSSAPLASKPCPLRGTQAVVADTQRGGLTSPHASKGGSASKARRVDTHTHTSGPKGETFPEVETIVLARGSGDFGVQIAGGDNSSLGFFYVAKVLPGSAAEADGRLTEGSRLLSLQGVDTAGMTQHELAMLLKVTRKFDSLCGLLYRNEHRGQDQRVWLYPTRPPSVPYTRVVDAGFHDAVA